jgi:hypothetical protein
MSDPSFTLPRRHIHLDFHTSPHIPDVGSEFSADAFAQTFKDAHADSVTIFAKCHHGMCYYPTKTGIQHPALHGRDLLGEQIEALHRAGLRAPVYTTVAWEEDVARRFPEWLQMTYDGNFARCANPDFNSDSVQPGGWWFNNFLHPDYQDYIEAHVIELLDNYDIDGLFFDILFYHGDAGWSPASRAFREQHNLMGRDAATMARFSTLAQTHFTNRFSALVRNKKKTASIFYNSVNPINADSTVGVRSRHEDQSHWELESLPSGFWGYHHFPRLARAFGGWGKPWLGQTGRFQRMWGDFGGLKPQPALEYETFRTQALGGANLIGDQLPPRGELDKGAYELIGKVYAQCEAAEPFYTSATTMPTIGIVAPGDPTVDADQSDKTLEGCVTMCDEAHYDSQVLDDASDFTGFALIILPDAVVVTDTLKAKLDAYLQSGGKLIASHNSGFGADGHNRIDALDIEKLGEEEISPTYWRADASFEENLALSDRVVYRPGNRVKAGADVDVLVERVLPYFKRTDLTFCSHFQAPPVKDPDAHPSVAGNDRVVYFADPIFREFRETGNIAVRDGWVAAMHKLIGPAPIGHGLPTTVLCVPLKSGSDLHITLLHYIPTRKAIEADMIEERGSFAGEQLRLPPAAAEVIDWETGTALRKLENGIFELPAKKGRLLLKVPGLVGSAGFELSKNPPSMNHD